jgi:hypothetical protein
MSRVRAPLVVTAVVVGVLIGAVAAAVSAGDGGGSPGELRVGPPVRPNDRLPDGTYDPERLALAVDPHSVRVDRRTRDPGGGPDWAVRVYTARRAVVRGRVRSLKGLRRRSPIRCAEVGRIHHGRFGWVFPGRFFRAIPAGGVEGSLGRCIEADQPSEPVAELRTALSFPSPSDPRLVRAVLWGVAPRGTRNVSITGLRDAVGDGRPGPGGGLLVLADRSTRSQDAAISATLRNGRRWRQAFGSRLTVGLPPRLPKHLRPPEVVPGSERLEAPAPDPAGGPPWGVKVADTRDGETCVAGETQAVEGRMGEIDRVYGLLTDHTAATTAACRPRSAAPTRRRPLDIGYGGASGFPLQGDPVLRRARIERRIVPGRFTVTISCHPDVESVTIQTPRDIRTLVPSDHGHVVFSIYDGSEAAGTLAVTAHLHGGDVYRQSFSLGF